MDNNCTLGADEGCNEDGDQYCTTLMPVIGTPPKCPGGGGDCNDANGNIYPNAPEWCDNNDQNCNGFVDEGCDDDADGYCDSTMWVIGAKTTVGKCLNSTGSTDGSLTKLGDDCNDDDLAVGPSVHPGVTEDCNTAYDDDCNGALDAMNTLHCKTFYYDSDSDGYGRGIPTGGPLPSSPDMSVCTCNAGFVPTYTTLVRGEDVTNCTDLDPLVNPGATETCLTPYDDNCNGLWNEQGKDGGTWYYYDYDGDGFGDPLVPPQKWCAPYGYYRVVGNATDCNDSNAMINGAVTKETCNDVDDNCNDVTDEGCDDDDDGYCDANYVKIAGVITTCASTPSASLVGDDCYDVDNANGDSIHPDAAETCNNVDDDCVGSAEAADQTQAVLTGSLTLATGKYYMQEVTPAVSGRLKAVQIPMQWTIGGNANLQLYSVKPTNPGGAGGTLVATATTGNNGTAAGTFVTMTFQFDQAPGTAAYLPAVTKDVKYFLVLTSPNAGSVQSSTATTYGGGALYYANSPDPYGAAITGSLAFTTIVSDGVGVDEGCDDDGDDYCDSVKTVVGALGSVAVCPLTPDGTGDDCADTVATVHPGVAEQCDDVDNNCTAGTDEDCDVDGDDYCNAFMVTTASAACPLGAGDCNDAAVGGLPVHPNAVEQCDDVDNNCAEQPSLATLTDQTQLNQVGTNPADAVVNTGTYVMQQIKATKTGTLQAIRVVLKGTATVTMQVYGTGIPTNGPPTTPAAGNGELLSTTTASVASAGYTWVTFDFNGQPASPVLPAASNGQFNYIVLSSPQSFSVGFDTGASYANGIYYTAAAAGSPFLTKAGDMMFQTFVGQSSGTQVIDENCDADDDGYCTAYMTTVGAPKICSSGGGDCNDRNSAVKPGASETCDNVDNNCVAGITPFPTPVVDQSQLVNTDATAIAVGGSVRQEVTPGATGVLQAVRIPIQWSGTGANVATLRVYSTNPASPGTGSGLLSTSTATFTGASAGYLPAYFYFNGAPATVPMLPATAAGTKRYFVLTATSGSAINVGSASAAPYAAGAFSAWTGTAWVAATNDLAFETFVNSGAGVDDGCDDDNDNFCDAAKTMGAASGTVKTCTGTRVGSGAGDDCNDGANTISPGVAEKCDNIDNNCFAGTDEDCDVDDDGYCNAYMVTVGTPTTCAGGGLDCDDQDANVKPAGVSEVCDNIDNNCNAFPALSALLDQQQPLQSMPALAKFSVAANTMVMQEIKPAIAGQLQSVRLLLQGGTTASPVTVKMSIFRTLPTPNEVGQVGDTNLIGYTTANVVSNNATGYTWVTFNFDGANASPQLPTLTTGASTYYYVVLTSTAAFNVGSKAGATTYAPVVNFGRYFTANLASDVAFVVDSSGDMVFQTYVKADGGTQVVDEGCDDDADDYCDSSMAVAGALGTVLVCPNTPPGASGNDCNDNNVVNTMTSCGIGGSCSVVACTGGDTACFAAAAKIHPGAEEVCDNIDNDCSGNSGDTLCGSEVANPNYWTCVKIDDGCDDDGDNYCDNTKWAVGALGSLSTCTLTPGQTPTPADTTYTVKGNDCNDSNDAVGGSTNPGMVDICNNQDDNCNSTTDEGCDSDGDEYCDSGLPVSIPVGLTSLPSCPKTLNSGAQGDDCNDTSALIHPGVTERCDNVDENCDGVTDDTCDDDGDDYCDKNVAKPVLNVAVCPNSLNAVGDDCDDAKVAVHPAALTAENCSTPDDDNCDGTTNSIDSQNCTYYIDNDGDTFGSGAAGHCYCAATGKYTAGEKVAGTPNNGDCDDFNGATYPGATEICDNEDNVCPQTGGGIDVGCDDDDDNYCDIGMNKAAGISVTTCTATASAAVVGDDCNDGKAIVGGADCAGNADCIKAAKRINPGAEEICDGVNNKCGATKDSGCDDDNDDYCDAGMKVTYTANYPTIAGNDESKNGCSLSVTHLALTPSMDPVFGDDCNESCNICYPGAPEVCDGVDNNCLSGADEGCKAATVDASFACAYGIVSGSSGIAGYSPVFMGMELGGTSQNDRVSGGTNISGLPLPKTLTLQAGFISFLQSLYTCPDGPLPCDQ